MNIFNINDAVHSITGAAFVIKSIRECPTTGKIHYSHEGSTGYYLEDELELISAAGSNPCAVIANMHTMVSAGIKLVKRIGYVAPCFHEWKGIQISNTKTVYDCKHCGIKKEHA